MSDLNCISLTGRAGRDTELRHFESGMRVASVSIAVNKRPSGSDPKPEAEWFDVTFWGNTAEVAAQFVKKGSQIAVTGRVSLERWTDRTGEERVKLAVNADTLTLLGGKPQDPAGQAGPGGNGGGQYASSQAAPQRQPAQRRAAAPAAHAAPAGRAPATAAYTEEIPF